MILYQKANSQYIHTVQVYQKQVEHNIIGVFIVQGVQVLVRYKAMNISQIMVGLMVYWKC